MTPSIPVDFPDWLSPMLVKEIRQGLRGKLFITGFILLHALLFLWTMTASLEETRDGPFSLDGFFWVILCAGLLGAALRGFAAIRQEHTRNTFELLQLTQQNAWKIVFGKWTAIMSQAGIFLASLMPYAVLRYFFGTLNAPQNLEILFFITAFTMIATAVTIFISSLPKNLYILAIIGCGVLTPWLISVTTLLFSLGAMGGAGIPSLSTMTGGDSLIFFIIVIFFTIAITLEFLLLAAGRIASTSENYATKKRLLGWLLYLPAIIAACIPNIDKSWGLFALAPTQLVALLFLDAVLSPTSPSVPVFLKFQKIKWLLPVLAPSRAAGVIYTILTLAFTLVLFMRLGSITGTDDILACIAVTLATANLFLVPLAVVKILRMAFKNVSVPLVFWLVNALFTFFTITCVLLGEIFSFSGHKFLACLSPVGVFMFATDAGVDSVIGVMIVLALIALMFLSQFLINDIKFALKMMNGEREKTPAF